MLFRRIYSLRFLLITAGVLAYFIWVQPVVLAALRNSISQPDYRLGLIMTAIQLSNIVAIFFKSPVVGKLIDGDTPTAYTPRLILHDIRLFVAVAALMCYAGFVFPLVSWTILSIFGIDICGTPPLWEGLTGFFFLFVMIILNAGVMLTVLIPQTARQAQLPEWLRPCDPSPAIVELLADIILAIFGVTSITLIWDHYAASIVFTFLSTQSGIANYLGATVFFLMFYPGVNVLSTVEELMSPRPLKMRLISAGFFLAVMITAIDNLVR